MYKIYKIGRAILLLSLVFHQALPGQEFSPKFKTFGNAEGLSQSVVLSVFQDSKNFLWFGTEDGLNKFDGYHFKVYRYDPEDSLSISDNWVNKIFLEDSDGDIWMFTGDRSINVFNPKIEQFTKIIPSEKGQDGLLPFQRVLFINQDSKGMIWISTDKGLFVLDKKSWKAQPVFVNDAAGTPRYFRKMYQGRDNKVWVCSTKGLLIWDQKSRKIFHDYFNGSNTPEKSIQDITDDADGNIWVISTGEIIGFKNAESFNKVIPFTASMATADAKPVATVKKGKYSVVEKDSHNNLWIGTPQGLFFFNIKTAKVNAYLSSPADNSTISDNSITCIYEDKKGILWFGTNNGLNSFLPQSHSFKRYSQKQGDISGKAISVIFEDKTGRIWTLDFTGGSDGAHLSYLDDKSDQLVHIRKDISKSGCLPSDLVYKPFIDRQGDIWFGTCGSGLLLYTPMLKNFDIIQHIPENKSSLAGNYSWAMSEDKRGKLWLALYQEGVDCYDPSTGKIDHYKDKLAKLIGERDFTILALGCDSNNHVWIGTLGYGIVLLDIATGKMKRFVHREGDPKSISSNHIMAISFDKSGNVLIAYGDNGFDIMDPSTGKITNYRNIPGNINSLRYNKVRYVIQSSDGKYWISTDGALTVLNRSDNTMVHYLPRKVGGRGILADKASVLFEDSRGNIWVGTHGGGISLFDRNRNEFKYWVEKNGLVNNVVYGILEDRSHKLWLSTNNGISCFDTDASKFSNYYANDGLPNGEFNANAFAKSKSGKMYFGGLNGITAFYPENILVDPVPPQVSITGFQVFNKKVEVLPYYKQDMVTDTSSRKIIEDGEHLYLTRNISYVDELELSYDYKVFTFEFAALRYDLPERCTYMYKMEGFEDDWNIAGTRRFANYTNLRPGKYVFKVTAANADGIWNPEPVKLTIIIKPPFYYTWWFISLAVASLILASTSIVMKRERNLKKAKAVLERKVKLRTQELNDKNEELILRNIQILKQKEEIDAQAKQLRVELAVQNQTSELALLRTQINPHFLFNTLNNIYSLVYQKSSEGPEALMRLSDIMRYMLYDTAADKVFVDNEIQYLKSFIELQLLRLKNKDFVSFEVTGDPTGKMIAPMLLVPFVENAFKHGSKSAPSPGIVINMKCSSELFTFEVRNKKNFSGTKDCCGGIGLVNVKRRLDLIYHEKYTLDIEDTDSKFETKLVILEK